MKLDSQALAQRVAQLGLEKKAQRVLILDVRELSTACDYFVIMHGTAEVQVRAITDHIAEMLEDEGVRPWHVEGRAARRWVLLDFVDVVAHVFHEEARAFYLLEKLWADAPMEEVSSGHPVAPFEDTEATDDEGAASAETEDSGAAGDAEAEGAGADAISETSARGKALHRANGH